MARVRIHEALHQRLEAAPAFPPSPLIVRLEDAGPELLTALGGKAGNLARVKNQLDLPVPDGAVATLSAYKLFMEQCAGRRRSGYGVPDSRGRGRHRPCLRSRRDGTYNVRLPRQRSHVHAKTESIPEQTAPH